MQKMCNIFLFSLVGQYALFTRFGGGGEMLASDTCCALDSLFKQKRPHAACLTGVLKAAYFFSQNVLLMFGSPERLPGVLKAVFFLQKNGPSILEALNVYRACSKLFFCSPEKNGPWIFETTWVCLTWQPIVGFTYPC